MAVGGSGLCTQQLVGQGRGASEVMPPEVAILRRATPDRVQVANPSGRFTRSSPTPRAPYWAVISIRSCDLSRRLPIPGYLSDLALPQTHICAGPPLAGARCLGPRKTDRVFIGVRDYLGMVMRSSLTIRGETQGCPRQAPAPNALSCAHETSCGVVFLASTDSSGYLPCRAPTDDPLAYV